VTVRAMKVFNFFLISVLSTGCFSAASETPSLMMQKEEISLGKVAVQDTISKQISIYNHGPGYLIIENVKSSCGSSILRWERNPIAPRQIGTIDLHVIPGKRIGLFSQTIVARTNAREIFKTFHLSGEIIDTSP
jgi:hypothetical protein